MNHAREVLQEVKAQRLAAEHIDALQKPWHTQLWPLAAQIPWIGLSFWMLVQQEPPRSLFMVGCIMGGVALGIAGVFGAMKARDRAWRDLIKREAPALDRKLSSEAPE